MQHRCRVSLKAASFHFLFSALVAAALAVLVLGVWYPDPFRELSGGNKLFWTVILVDVVCGPLLTLVVFDPKKARLELVTDLSLVVLVQLGALAYGVYSVALARPVVVAFEVDRFVAVPAAWVDTPSLDQALPQFRRLSWTGPVLVGTRQARSSKEVNESLQLSLQGLEISARPGWWIPYSDSIAAVKQRMRKVDELRAKRSAAEQARIDAAVSGTGAAVDELYYLPLTSRELTDWIVLLDAQADIKGYVQVDGF